MLYTLHNLSDKELLQRADKHPDDAIISVLLGRYCHLITAVCLYYHPDEGEAQAAIRRVLQQLDIDLQNHPIRQFNQQVYKVCMRECGVNAGENADIAEKWADGSVDPISALSVAEKQLLQDFYLKRRPLKELARRNKTSVPDVVKQLRRSKEKFINYLPQN
jgi:hypothetical protein